jgi:hypothetical protein
MESAFYQGLHLSSLNPKPKFTRSSRNFVQGALEMQTKDLSCLYWSGSRVAVGSTGHILLVSTFTSCVC